jgi:hypothetical protein
MSRKSLIRWLLTIALLLVVTIIWFAISASPVSADCGTPPKSSCISCHASDGHVEGMGEWNSVHLSQDMCTNCHGGNGSTMDKGLAHQGMVAQPLSDTYTDCHSCHPADYKARSAQMAAALNVTPDCVATPTAFAISSGSGGSHTGSTTTPSGGTGALTSWKPIMFIAGALASLTFFLFGLGWLDSHRVKV